MLYDNNLIRETENKLYHQTETASKHQEQRRRGVSG